MNKFFGHLNNVLTHRHLVFRFCCRVGIPLQGLLHDLSKFTPTEFIPSVRYFQGNMSPIGAERRANGYSMAWLHHKARNKHHWEYWLDRGGKEGKLMCFEMPKNYVKESVCDRVAACMIYQKEKYTDASAYNYFMNGNDKDYMHPNSAELMKHYLTLIKEKGLDEAFKIIKADV